MRIEVGFSRQTLIVEFDDSQQAPTLMDLKQKLFSMTGVPPSMQKLLGKIAWNNEKNLGKSLEELGMCDGTRIMLVGSAVKEVLSTITPTPVMDKKVEEACRRLLHSLPESMWLLDSYAGFMADAYVDGKGHPLENGTAVVALLTLDTALVRLNTPSAGAHGNDDVRNSSAIVNTQLREALGEVGMEVIWHPLLRSLNEVERQAIQRAHNVIRRCYSFAEQAAGAKGPAQVLNVVKKAVSLVSELEVGGWLMMPGGWCGLNSMHVIYLLLKRTGQQSFTFVVVNRGDDGGAYHPSWQTEDKIVTCPVLCFSNVSEARLTDHAFWLLMLSLWMRGSHTEERSEFSRAEVFYDVLLPWLVEKEPGRSGAHATLRSATEMILSMSSNNEATPSCANAELSGFTSFIRCQGATMTRSASGGIKNAVTSFTFLLEQFGVHDKPVRKLVKFALKYEFMLRAAEDLLAHAQRFTRCFNNGKQSTVEEEVATGGERGSRASEVVSRIEVALQKLSAAGVSVSTSANYLSALIRTATAKKIVVTNNKNIIVKEDHFVDKYVLVYCGGLQEKSCQKFSRLLAEATGRLRSALPNMELLFVSGDVTREKYEEHCSLFSFSRTTFPCQALLEALDVVRLPQLILFAPDGQLIHRRGVWALHADPEALTFPWGDVWSGATPLTAVDVAMLNCSAAVLAHHTRKRLGTGESGGGDPRGRGFISAIEADRVLRLLDAVGEMVAVLPKESLVESCYPSSGGARVGDGAEATGRPNPPEKVFIAADIVEEHVPPHEPKNEQGIDNGDCAHDASIKRSLFSNASLLPAAPTAAYRGKTLQAEVPELKDLGDICRAGSWTQLDYALRRATASVGALWSRARHSGTASRVAVLMHITELISWLFLRIVPLPLPRGMNTEELPVEERDCVSQFYTTEPFPASSNVAGSSGDTTDVQTSIQECIYSLMLSYANAWQAIEIPTRAYDAERAITAMEMLLVYDAVARHTSYTDGSSNKKCALLASMLNCGGGYYLSTTVGRQNLSFVDVSGAMELVRPQFLFQRAAIIRYIRKQQIQCSKELFDLRMADKLELRKGSETVRFLRLFLDNCGYGLQDTSGPSGLNLAGQSEMDQLMQWFCSSRTPLAHAHPEFCRLRDMVLLTKFLVSMEMRDAQLLRRRRQLDADGVDGGRPPTWRLTFDGDTPGLQMSAGWRTKPEAPYWECILVRGRDSDIADISVIGFGGRELNYGEGLLLHSPIDVGVMLGVEQATEDDVVHATPSSLPTFGGVMSVEESEVLLTSLTAPYLRLPLILDFFASQDRHTYLFSTSVQNLFRAALFEPSAYATEEEQKVEPALVPMRLGRQQRLVPSFSLENFEACLGTPYGLLLNELQRSPDAILEPLRTILLTIGDIGPSSVYSTNASFTLFIVGVVCDVFNFCSVALDWQLRRLNSSTLLDHDDQWDKLEAAKEVLTVLPSAMLTFLIQTVQPILKQWCKESATNDDTPTQCVVHSYMATIHRAVWKFSAFMTLPLSLASSDHLVSFLESCAFVRTRHSFGMGLQRTQLAMQDGDELLTPEEKLLRFLQAQGLDTSKATGSTLEEVRQLMLTGGHRRAVFVQIRSGYYTDTVRVPNLFRSDARSTTDSRRLKLPPADVPENVLFCHLLEDYSSIMSFLGSLDDMALASTLQCIVNVVLRDHHQESHAPISPGCRDDGGSGAGRAATVTVVRRSLSGSIRDGGAGVWEERGGVVNEAADAGSANGPGSEVRPTPWRQTAPGVFCGPSSTGLVFHVHTCELFWQSNELKPVPDSMSHFSDFESVIGRDVLQCGLVSRSSACHWVHIVGTPFDVMEWTPHDPLDQGARAPLLLSGDLPKEPATSAFFDGVVFDRPVDVFDETPWETLSERWAVELLRAVLREEFPTQQLRYFPIAQARKVPLQTSPAAGGQEGFFDGSEKVHTFRFLMCDAPQYVDDEERATWKEVVAYLFPTPHLHIFNLISHARQMYRSLIFTSNQRWCLHSLMPITRMRRREKFQLLAFQSGELVRRVRCEGSIEIHRFSSELGLREVFVPARLLQGVVPSVLLEAFVFWRDSQNNIRGYPSGDSQSYWFNYTLLVRLDCDSHGLEEEGSREGVHWNCQIIRRNGVLHSPAGGRKRLRSQERSHLGNEEEVVSRGMEVGDGQVSVTDAHVALVHSALPFIAAGTCRWILEKTGNDVQAAIRYAFDPENLESIKALDTSERAKKSEEEQEKEDMLRCSSGAGGRGEEEPSPLPSRGEECQKCGGTGGQSEQLVLLNALQDASLFPLLHILTQLEDCSHILVWGRASSTVGPSSTERTHDTKASSREKATHLLCVSGVVSIELPRLRAKFYPHVDASTGRLRLHLADHPGWFIAEAEDLPRAEGEDDDDFLSRLREPFQQCVTLCNGANEFAFMVPNHDFTPIHIEGDPFSSLLLFDRSSLRWQESVASTFYLYTVHPCGSFLLPPSFAAALYYAVLQCATRNYAGSMRTLESCYKDNVFTTEEAFMFELMGRTLNDRYPDAHAVRLKLAHAVLYGPQKLQWPLGADLAAYLKKKRHVSRSCRLTQNELMDLMRRCDKAIPIVHSQLQLWASLERRGTHPGESGVSSLCAPAAPLVSLDVPQMRFCGEPWERLLMHPWSRISPQKPQRLTYEPPDAEALQEEALVDFVWKDKLISDEESGGNGKLGFYFLYSLLQSESLVPKLAEEDVRVTLGQLWARWFHLRHARWGREQKEEGEAEACPSWCGAVLMLLSLAPSANWPGVLRGVRLERGITLTTPGSSRDVGISEMGFTSRSTREGVIFYDKLEQVARSVFEKSGTVVKQRELFLLRRGQLFVNRSVSVRAQGEGFHRLVPTNTGMAKIQLPFHAFYSSLQRVARAGGSLGNEEVEEGMGTAFGCWDQRLVTLINSPLGELLLDEKFVRLESVALLDENEGIVSEDGSEGYCRSGLPFDLRDHAQCGTPLAKYMLSRLEADANCYAMQRKSQKRVRRSLTALSAERLHLILCGDVSASVVHEEVSAAMHELGLCVDALTEMGARDHALVRRLTHSVLRLANDIYQGTVDTSDSGAALLLCDFRLQRIKGDSCAASLEWLLRALLSTDMDSDLRASNLYHGDLQQIQVELVLLMLFTSRAHMVQQAKQAIRQVVMFLEMCTLLRCGCVQTHSRDLPSSFQARGAEAGDAHRVHLQKLLQCFSIGVDLSLLFHTDDEEDGMATRRSAGPLSTSGCAIQCRKLPDDLVSSLKVRAEHVANEAVSALTTERHCVVVSGATNTQTPGSQLGAPCVTFDPRYLLFEFIHCILLRKRQVEMVQSFVKDIHSNVSRVQQMIMGQGKTTVVAPLLALILADGEQLVTQVMPTALLEQTSVILRRCFSVVIPKQIYTLQFDRSINDSDIDQVELLRQKLTAAARRRAIFISAPECIKSVFLKMVEQLHMIETVSGNEFDALCDTASAAAVVEGSGEVLEDRGALHAQEFIRRIGQRSAMADAIAPIIQLWQRGVVIMDEVDVLLHPLRSELNFPIGAKHPIELSGPRWEFPMHLFDAIFYCKGVTPTCNDNLFPLQQDHAINEAAEKEFREKTLATIRNVVFAGYQSRALQREPHIVLLDGAYYHQQLLPALLPWSQLWLFSALKKVNAVMVEGPGESKWAREWSAFLDLTTSFLQKMERPSEDSQVGQLINQRLSSYGIQLLCLVHNWLHCLMPHVLSKIDRVSFGLLQPHELAILSPEAQKLVPRSRQLMAIPFVAKDVPSLSSEFAHPDVVIGLTVLAYRYEGMRLSDVKELLRDLKRDFAQQTGPKEHRPAAQLYRQWLRVSAASSAGFKGHKTPHSSPLPSSSVGSEAGTGQAVLSYDCSGVPLSQLQMSDDAAVEALYHRLRHVTEVIYYYLSSHVFPRTMNFQSMKISACGHELGSSMLFTRRIGFSGTPSNLLPHDLGECLYEPGSDGRVLSVLTDPAVVSVELLQPDWTPLHILDQIAAERSRPFHALIDAGALITNMDNETVARYLLDRLSPDLFDGVVFLDAMDRQMILQRSNGLMVPVVQSGVALNRRFTFFDQVHTTGTDVKQAASATAVVTLGKDLV
ncbi:hypothetical protein, conserved, partial [Trypanosoma vivax Y486]